MLWRPGVEIAVMKTRELLNEWSRFVENEKLDGLAPEIKQEIEQAFEDWKEIKKTATTTNPIIDAYLRYAKLMKKYVDPNWS